MKIFLTGTVPIAFDKLNRYDCYEKVIKNCFKNAEVLTPNDITKYWKECKKKHTTYSKSEVDKMTTDYEIEQIRQSDLIVCDLSTSTTSTGLILGIAYERNIKVIFGYETKPMVCRMAAAAFPSSTFIEYKDLDELSTKLTKVLLENK